MSRSVDGLELRIGYFADHDAFSALADLLQDIFSIDIGQLDRFGGPNTAAMPFGYFDRQGRCVANFSAVSMPLIIDGRHVAAVGYQSGAVRPEFRGQGLFRDLMLRAFAWATTQDFDLGILLTDKPDLYRPYGFRSVAQHAFHDAKPASPTRQVARRLSLENPADVELIRRLLASRQPVSNVFAVRGHADFLLNACFDPDIQLSYLPDRDAVIAWKEEASALLLLDIVAAAIPPLSDVAGALGTRQPDMIVCFPPDRLDWPEAAIRPNAGSCALMIASMKQALLPSGPFMLSPMADF